MALSYVSQIWCMNKNRHTQITLFRTFSFRNLDYKVSCWYDYNSSDFIYKTSHFAVTNKTEVVHKDQFWQPPPMTKLWNGTEKTFTCRPYACSMSILHIGQVLCSKSHGSTQDLWNTCLQDRQVSSTQMQPVLYVETVECGRMPLAKLHVS